MNTVTKDTAGNKLFTASVREKNIDRCGYPYKFSIITAVYNVENVLHETIASVLEQSIGFAENVQFILVNDGSPDKSGEICDEYAQQYPDNIIVIHKENGGAASARNAGLEYATGKYLNFLDSDDKFSLNVLKTVYDFFEKHRGNTDVVTIPMYFFGITSEPYWQNWKFSRGSRVIDLLLEPLILCMSASASFFKNERKNDINFDIRLANAEDMKVILVQICPKMTLGVVSKVKYLYRRQSSRNSLSQTTMLKKEWYLNFVPYLLRWMYDFYMEKLGFFPTTVQYMLLCDYQWHIRDEHHALEILSPEEVQEYKVQLYGILKLFDDQCIIELKKIYREHKLFLLSKKYDDNLKEVQRNSDRYHLYAGNPRTFLESSTICKIDFLNLEDGVFSIEGWTRIFGFEKPEDIKVFLKVNERFILCDKTEKDRSLYFLGDLMSLGVGFKSSINLDEVGAKNCRIEIHVEINGHKITKKSIQLSEFCPLTTNSPKNMFFYDCRRALTYHNGAFYIVACNRLSWLRREGRLLLELSRTKDGGAKRAVWRRILCHITALFQKKKRWIISDRVDRAGDNGEALFRYLAKIKDNEVDCCFAIEKSSPDYKRLKEFGKVIPFRGWRHKLYCVQGAKIISSHSYRPCKYPLVSDTKYYQDLFSKTKFIFLQHGITKDDLSKIFHRYAKNFNLFITATMPEYNSILEYEYFYTEKEVKLTGFPRHDMLVRDEKKYITIMPTWRSYLFVHFNEASGERKLADDFQNSLFCRFYHDLFNHPQLLAAVTKYGYTLCYMPHPELDAYSAKFTGTNQQVKVFDTTTPYKDVFAESDMIVTDYSSVAFDFAYLRKPVLYCHFDAEDFFGNHGYAKGYFDYEHDGFGEVVYDLDATVECIIEYMRNDCKLKNKYRQRIENTFAFNDQNNCERVYQAIKGLDH